MKKFDYICCGKYGDINEFSIFANIISKDDKYVTIERYQRYGQFKCSNNTMRIEDFKRFYRKIEEKE